MVVAIIVHGLLNSTKIFDGSVHSSLCQMKPKLSSKVVGVGKLEAIKLFRMENHVPIEFALPTGDLV
jgi:hypothetical protein